MQSLAAIVTPFLTFPDIAWWSQAARAQEVIFDAAEHFEKMTFRNKYRISGANNSILLSVPLVNGRDQRTPMGQVRILNRERWQVRHWRTLVSVYSRAPYFAHYEAALRPLFEQEFDLLKDFNRAGIEWIRAQLRLEFTVRETTVFEKVYPPEITDLRHEKANKVSGVNTRRYHQVFEDRIGFQPNLSMLDLLFSEGPAAVEWLRQ